MSRPIKRFQITYNVFAGMATILAALRGSQARVYGGSAATQYSAGNVTSEHWRGGVASYDSVEASREDLQDLDTIWYEDTLLSAEGEEREEIVKDVDLDSDQQPEVQSASRRDAASKEESLEGGLGMSSVNEPIPPEEMDFYSLSRQGYADSLKMGSRVIDLSPNFERHKEGDLVFAMPKEIINLQGVVIPLHVGDSRNFNSPSRRLRIVFNEEDFPRRLPPILFDIPGGYSTGTMFGMADHNRGESWMKVRPRDGSEPLEVSILSRSADGTETSLTSEEITAVGVAQGAIAASNKAKALYAGDPVSGRVNAMTGIRMHDPAHRNHILDLHRDMPISQEAQGVTVDLESYFYEFFATGASLDVIVDATRFSTVPIRFVDGSHRVELEVDGGRVRMTSSRSGVEPIDVGFQGRGSDGVLRGLPGQSLLDYVERHNRGVDTSRSASRSPGSSPESVIISDRVVQEVNRSI